MAEFIHWVDSTRGFRPPLAHRAGIEGSLHMFVARGNFNGHYVPGKTTSLFTDAYIPYNGKEVVVGHYQVLVAPEGCLSWVPASGNNLPAHAVVGGSDPGTHEHLYVGRAVHNGMVIPGKVHISHGCCYVAYDGREHSCPHYEVLVKNALGRHLNL